MRSKIIYDTYIGPPVFGVITADDILSRRAVFIEQLKNLLGFRTYYPKVEYSNFVFYEVGYFMELLYQGSPEAFTMINMSDEYVEQSSHEIRIIKDKKKDLISKALPINLLEYCLGRKDDMLKGSSYFSDEKSLKKLGYDKNLAYICSLYLRLAKDTLITGEFKVERNDAEMLVAIKEGRFSVKTVEKEFEAQVEEVRKLLKNSNLPNNPSKDMINEMLFKIRGIEQIEEIQRIYG